MRRIKKSFSILFLILSFVQNSFCMDQRVSVVSKKKQNHFKEVPIEVVIHILEFLCISPEDISRLRRTCKAFNDACCKILSNSSGTLQHFDLFKILSLDIIPKQFENYEEESLYILNCMRFINLKKFLGGLGETGLKVKRLDLVDLKIYEAGFRELMGCVGSVKIIGISKCFFYKENGDFLVEDLTELFKEVLPENLKLLVVDLVVFDQLEALLKGVHGKGLRGVSVNLHDCTNVDRLAEMFRIEGLESLGLNTCTGMVGEIKGNAIRRIFDSVKNLKYFGFAGKRSLLEEIDFLSDIPESISKIYLNLKNFDIEKRRIVKSLKQVRDLKISCWRLAGSSDSTRNFASDVDNLIEYLNSNIEKVEIFVSYCKNRVGVIDTLKDVYLKGVEDILKSGKFLNLKKVKFVCMGAGLFSKFPNIGGVSKVGNEERLRLDDILELRRKFPGVKIALETRA